MISGQAALAALTLFCLAITQPAAAEESGWVAQPETSSAAGSGTVKCESHDDARRHCAVKNIDTGSVTLQRKLSQSACHRGADWGVDRDGIWVDKGCRAVFAYKVRYGGGSSSSSKPGGYGTIQCESNDDRRKHCSVSNIDPDSVTMERKLSQANCYRGQNWGADSSGIWVDNGCRARFAYVSRSGRTPWRWRGFGFLDAPGVHRPGRPRMVRDHLQPGDHPLRTAAERRLSLQCPEQAHLRHLHGRPQRQRLPAGHPLDPAD